jgi:hypothetical protein
MKGLPRESLGESNEGFHEQEMRGERERERRRRGGGEEEQ